MLRQVLRVRPILISVYLSILGLASPTLGLAAYYPEAAP